MKDRDSIKYVAKKAAKAEEKVQRGENRRPKKTSWASPKK